MVNYMNNMEKSVFSILLYIETFLLDGQCLIIEIYEYVKVIGWDMNTYYISK